MEKTMKEKEAMVNVPYNLMLFVVMAEFIGLFMNLRWVVQNAALSLLIAVCTFIILGAFKMIGESKREEEEENIDANVRSGIAVIGGSIIVFLVIVLIIVISLHFLGVKDDTVSKQETAKVEKVQEKPLIPEATRVPGEFVKKGMKL